MTPQTIEFLWPAMIDYLETDFVSSAPISAAYDLANTLPAVRHPVLLLGARTDTLAAHFARAAEYAAVLANFLDGTSSQAGTV
ncbi:MAG: hypothetical protein EBU76_00250 [Gammaproteobacteria bacterium]|nr:hypothetical protein [Gammaproteobacteria bacterium]